MLAMPIMQAAAWTALFNILAGLAFLWRYHAHVRFAKALLVCHIVLLALFGFILVMGSSWMNSLSNVLYKDKVIYSQATKYQHVVLTERLSKNQPAPITDLYLNGRLQFSSIDEQIYHSMLVYPAMLASNRHDSVLIIGGGDGLALRDVLKWPVNDVTLIDLDAQLLNLFGHKDGDFTAPESISKRLLALNKQSMLDPRANIPDLNKMYSDYFYNHVRQLLAPDGAMAVQSTSPYHAKKAFLSIAKTVKAAGFDYVEQYQQNIPSFGQWGWTIATKMGQPASGRIKNISAMPVPSRWVSKEYLLASFVFPNQYFEQVKSIEVNRLGSGQLYDYYRNAWQIESELYKN